MHAIHLKSQGDQAFQVIYTIHSTKASYTRACRVHPRVSTQLLNMPSTKNTERTSEKPLPPTKERSKGPSSLSRAYLIAFNVVSALGWAYVLVLTLNAVANPPTIKAQASSFFSRVLSYLPVSVGSKVRATNQLSASLSATVARFVPPSYSASFSAVAPVQSLALLEVIHVIVGLVRSPLPTTAMQVASRLLLVWGIVARFPNTHANPVYTTMVLAWSLTEVPRYAFYALGLTGAAAPQWLTWLRYTTFYVLYPLGAGSEAMLMLSTVPEWRKGGWQRFGVEDWARSVLFAIWWPGLYVMYTYMMQQRRKVLGGTQGQKLGGKSKAKAD